MCWQGIIITPLVEEPWKHVHSHCTHIPRASCQRITRIIIAIIIMLSLNVAITTVA